MFNKPIEMAHASHKKAQGRQLLLSFIALSFALTIHPSKAHAQIIGELEANIPFQFHAGNVKLPAGKYLIHMLDGGADPGVMEITNADGSTAALFEVQQAQANSSPAKSELIFDKYVLFMALVFALALYPDQAHAQIIGNLEVNIPESLLPHEVV